MWDLDTLHYLNEMAVQGAEERRAELTVPTSSILPLSVMADRLTYGPPSLSALVDLFEQSRSLGDFLELIREFLPEYEREIMAGSIDSRLEKFCHRFGNRYFPLADRALDELSLDDFCAYIPVDLMGFSYDDYHEFESYRPGIIMMMSLVAYPYVDPEPCSRGIFKGYDGSRVPIIEEVARLTNKELATQIPEKGWTLEQLHQMTDGTKYDGVTACADWICQETGCWQLDATFEGYSEETWSREVVEGLTEQWPRVREIQDKIGGLAEWLEDSPATNFRELLYHLLGKQDSIVPKEQMPFPLDENGQVKPKTLMEIFSQEEVTASDDNGNENPLRQATREDLEALTRV